MAISDYRIIKATKKPFKNSEGEMMDYFWYKAERLSDNLVIEFGSTEEHEKDEELTLDLEKRELAGGKTGWREVVQRT